MSRHFLHPQFRRFEFESVPCNRDVFLMDERWIPEWEKAYLDLFQGKEFRSVGYISYAAVRLATTEFLEISWYPNIYERFHEVSIILPRTNFVACVDVPDCDGKPCIFVRGDWLSKLHLSPNSAFSLIDAIGVRRALTSGELSGDKLLELRDKLDRFADAVPGVAFVSFADSLLLKVNWFVGQYDSEINYSYQPESLMCLFPKIANIFQEVLGLSIYATVTQGINSYDDSALIHQSPGGAHFSLNSLGIPFAQLLAIDVAARHAIRHGLHNRYELYLDELFFRSLNFKSGFDKRNHPVGSYIAPLSDVPRKYYCAQAKVILDNLETLPS